ncbi:hypothetical protein IWW40_002166 [Coemansia sp. RSA 1250]|nr:hypothetical protein IWW40_002166 [Coemansia sp. RSA 1250]
MNGLVEYLVGVVESSYEDLAHLVPCGSFLGLFDERPVKRIRKTALQANANGLGWQNALFEFDTSEATFRAILQLTQEALAQGAKAADVLRIVVDAVRNIHDGSAVLDIGFRVLYEIYQQRLQYHSVNRYRTDAADAQENNTGAETFGEEYLLLAQLFELHRPRTWVATVRLMSMVTKSAIRIMYGSTTASDAGGGTHAASLSEISGRNLLPENVCRECIRQVWRLLLDSAATEPVQASVLGAARRTRWQIRFEATMELFDSMVGRAEQCLGRPLVSYYMISRELDPGAAVAESGMLTGEMQCIVDLCFGRKRRLGRILLPPDGSWPLISHASRAHTVKHVYDQPGYALVRDSLTLEETQRGASANRVVADLLYQRAPIDEVFAAMRNHRIMQRKAIAAVASESYVPNSANGVNMIGAGVVGGTGVAAGGSSASDSGEAERREASMLLLDAMARRTEQIVRFIQSQCDFDTLLDERKLNSNSDATMIVPRNFSYWEYMNEVADQLYYFVLTDTISYQDIHDKFFSMVFPADSDIHPGSETRKDNSYIWLLLQLLHIEKVAAGPVQQDLAGDEDMLDQLVQMYNERQIVSRDAFYLRDLSLQATMSHQQGNIRDNHGVKFRHPRIAVAMPFAPVLYQLQNEFGQQFKEENYTLLEGRDTCTVMKTATVSQIRQYVVPNALYTYLVPAREKVQRLQSEATTYLQGGNIGYRLLDYINVGGKHRLLQLIYKMMLAHEQGPQFQFDGRQPSARSGITCVSPHVVDTVYMLLYNAPYSNELMMKEVLEKLRRSDKAMAQGNARFSPANLRWLYTVYQLMNCRLLRFFKYYAHASHLVHHLRHSLINVTHWQLYRSLECFALCLVNLQHDVGFLQALMNPAYHGVPLTPHPSTLGAIRYSKPKDAWFECGMLSRNAAVVIARIETMRGLGDVPGLALDDCLDSLSPQPQLWAPAVLRYLPRAVRAYYARRAPQACPRAAPAAIRQLVDARSEHAALLQQTGDAQTEAALTAFYAARERQALFLCVVWVLCEQQKPLAMAVVRRVLLRFPPAHMSAHTSALVDFIVANENERGLTGPGASTKQLLNDFMFRLQLVHHEHVVFALTRGEHDLRTDQMRLGLTRYVLLESQQFSERLDEWHRLDFQGRYWADFTHWQKQQAYMARFPEYFEFEAAVEGPLEPPPALSLPVYYENAMVRLLPILEFALGRMIEAEDRELLRDVLDRMGILYRLHQVPLTTLMNTLFVYFNAPTLHEATVVRSLNRALLDMSQQNFSREFEQFMSGDINDCSHIGAPYVGRIMERIARAISRHLTTADKQNLPEIHYREIPNPILLVLTECVVELLTWWCLHCAPSSDTRLYNPATGKPLPKTEAEFRAEEQQRRKRAAEWPLAKLWLKLTMDPAQRPEPGLYTGAAYIHSTGVLANVLPDELLAFPIIEHLSHIVLQEPILKTISGPKRYFSFVEFARTSRLHADDSGASTQFAATSVFNSFEQNRLHNMANPANTYLTLLHSVLHYGGIATFNTLSDTIHELASGGELCSDIQLLYLCATVGPILYRLVDHNSLYVQILGDLLSILVQICPRISHLDSAFSTDAIEQIMDFICFVKDQFDPGRAAWRRLAPHIAALPTLLKYQLQCVVDQ